MEEKTIAEVKRLLGAHTEGLTEAEVKTRLWQYGPNELEEKKRATGIRRFLSQMMDPLIYVLLAAGLISLLLGEAQDAAIIAVVVLLNAAVGVIQEGKAWKALQALKKLTRQKALVRRDGDVREIDAADLVPGDVVLLEAGCQVPADLRLIFTENLRIEESALTGESVPVTKEAAFLAKKELPLGDRKNMAYMSSNVTAGRGEGFVSATGMNTEIGKIAKLIHETPDEMTPLQKRLGDLGSFLSILAVGLCAALFFLALAQKRNAAEMLITAISLAVAAVPEGLPAVVTIVLALSVSKMVRVNTIVRRLPSVETLGAVSVVCSDKTGTLTQNKMKVEVWETAEKILSGKDGGKDDELFLAFVLCNDAKPGPDGVLGDPTEAALLAYAERAGKEKIKEVRGKWTRVAERPFEAGRKKMTTVHKKGADMVSYTKGAPDIILQGCSRYLSGGEEHVLTKFQKRRILKRVEELSGEAFRVLAAARAEGDGRRETEMVFLGLAAMEDPPRPEAAGAVKLFQEAHVRTVMITGDHRDTAFAIAQKLGIAREQAECMTGEELDRLGQEERRQRIPLIRVFARVSPEHKVKIVQYMKEEGNIVAMTGDGINDAPSLKAADVGIAMGKSGTDVAKQAADMILTDDNFATIEKAMEEGRGVYENIRKSVLFLLSSNLGEIMTMFLAVLCALPSPLKPSHILWINLITDSLPALALGVDENDGKALMKEPPRKPGESLFARGGGACMIFYGLLITLISIMAFLQVPIGLLMEAGQTVTLPALARILQDESVLSVCQTYSFTVLGLSQLFHAVGMRDTERSVFCMNHLENRLMLAALAIGFLLQLAVTEIPFLVAAFGTVRLSGAEWCGLLFLASMPMVAHEILVISGRILEEL